MAVVTAVGVLSATPLTAEPASAQGCTVWSGEGSLQEAVTANPCVQLPAGVHLLDRFLIVPGGHTLQGDPSVPRDAIVLKAIEGWVNTPGDGVVNDDGYEGATATLVHFTIDGNGQATGGLGARRLRVDDLAITGGRCWGVAVAGDDMTVTNSWIHHNGADPGCFGAPGAGVYMTTLKPNGAPSNYAPIFTGNWITDNTGPGLDIASVWSGTLVGNVIVNNSSWAGVSLFGSRWTITDNAIHHPATNEGQPYINSCRGGPSGVHSAAIFLCQRNDRYNNVTVDNVISNNAVASWYGILVIGNDGVQPYYAPRNNQIGPNNAFGSHHAFADDFRPRQWFGDRNSWITRPSYF